MEKISITIDPKVLENVKRIIHGNSTSDGVFMLGLENDSKYNYAGNTYLDVLREIHFLMKQLGIDSQLYE